MTPLIRAILRHIIGYFILLPLILVAIAIQALIANPVFKNQTLIPNLIYNAIGRLFGVRFKLNPHSAPFEANTSTMFVLNHLSRLDFVALPLFPHAAVMMNANIFQMPFWGSFVKAFTSSSGFIATRQTKEHKHQDQDLLGQAAQDGRNILVFPEGIQTDGRRVLRYSMGSAEIFYDEDLIVKYPALRSAILRPVVLRVGSVAGVNVMDHPDKWGRYALSIRLTNIFTGMTRLALVKSVTIDTLVCAPLNPRDFETATDLMNAAHNITRAIVAPGQTETLTRKQWKARVDAMDFSL